MKKILLSLIIVLTSTTFLNAQDIYLSWDGEMLEDTVVVRGLPTDFQIVFEAICNNNTNDTLIIKVAKEELEILDSTINTFCWGGSCYGPMTDTSGNADTIPPGGSSNIGDFSGDYEPHNQIGTSTIKYTFFNIDNPEQKAEVVVIYSASTDGLAEEAMNGGSISEVYPNPANYFVNLDYQLTSKVNTATVKIFNLLGATVKEAVLERGSNKLKMDVSGLNNGIYFYSVLINGDIYKTKKLIIQR